MKTTRVYTLAELREEFGRYKTIPLKYENIILTALSHYPEVKDLHIDFKLVDKHPVPYGTSPTLSSFVKEAHERKYNITILEEAIPPTWHALLRNLPREAQVGVLGHEIAHVVQYNTYSISELLQTIFLYIKSSFRQKIERAADKIAIEHGLGRELHTQATYIRNIPGYIEQRRELDRNYLKPEEILLIQNSNMGL